MVFGRYNWYQKLAHYVIIETHNSNISLENIMGIGKQSKTLNKSTN